MITHEESLLNFHQQIEYALNTFEESKVPTEAVHSVVICGLGGSGIGGRIARGYFLNKAQCPIEVYSHYFLPKYINKHTLVILSSYSGNTEETLQMFEHAQAAGCQMIGICSGGALHEKLLQGNYPVFMVPKGFQPRMALGFSFSLNLLVLGKLFGQPIRTELEGVLNLYSKQSEMKAEAAALVSSWSANANEPIVIYSDEHYAGVAVRFCQQVQENAKGQAFSLVLPEANHNAIESIYGNVASNVLFLNAGTNERNNLRFDFLKQVLTSNGNAVASIHLKDASLMELFRCIYILDWASILLSNLKGVDNMTVPNIDKLKDYLSKA
jgi:glucose/mannose-6-phosphate isomerase